jgi:hypothetical protein
MVARRHRPGVARPEGGVEAADQRFVGMHGGMTREGRGDRRAAEAAATTTTSLANRARLHLLADAAAAGVVADRE